MVYKGLQHISNEDVSIGNQHLAETDAKMCSKYALMRWHTFASFV